MAGIPQGDSLLPGPHGVLVQGFQVSFKSLAHVAQGLASRFGARHRLTGFSVVQDQTRDLINIVTLP